MKNMIICLLCFASFKSSAQNGTDKFVGAWDAVNQSKQIKHIDIKKVNNHYYLNYNNFSDFKRGEIIHQNVVVMGSETYILRDGCLFNEKNNKKVAINSSGNLKWRHKEWTKATH